MSHPKGGRANTRPTAGGIGLVWSVRNPIDRRSSQRRSREEAAMSTAFVTPPILMTAEEYARRPEPGHPEELVRGRIVPVSQPNRRHGQICNKAGRILGNFAEDHDLGHVLSNDAGVITERDPDTVRGADIAFYSYARLPKGPLPGNLGPEVPELVVEVRSPSERWPKILVKVAEYLDAGVTVVVVLDDESRTASLYFSDRPTLTLTLDDELTLPEILPGFAVAVRRFFE
jgi:Uma2 family endonuclease